jgi:hypothetical protein
MITQEEWMGRRGGRRRWRCSSSTISRLQAAWFPSDSADVEPGACQCRSRRTSRRSLGLRILARIESPACEHETPLRAASPSSHNAAGLDL